MASDINNWPRFEITMITCCSSTILAKSTLSLPKRTLGRQYTRARRFCKKTETENRYEITEITESFDQLNYCDQNKQRVLCVIIIIFI